MGTNKISSCHNNQRNVDRFSLLEPEAVTVPQFLTLCNQAFQFLSGHSEKLLLFVLLFVLSFGDSLARLSKQLYTPVLEHILPQPLKVAGILGQPQNPVLRNVC